MGWRNYSISALMSLVALSPVPAPALAQVPTYRPFSVESSRYHVDLIGWERYGPEYASIRFRFRLQNTQSGPERFFEITNATTSLENGTIAGNVLLLVGDVQGLATGLTLIDLARVEVIHFVLSYGGEVSPDGTMFIYTRFYPRTVPLALESDVVMAQSLIATDDHSAKLSSAQPVYPPPPSPSEVVDRHYVLRQTGYLWLDDPRRVAFIEMSEGAPWLVVVDLSRGPMEPRSARRRIPVEEIIKPRPGSDEYERTLERERSSLSAVGLRKGPEGRVVIELAKERHREGLFAVTEIAVDLPQETPEKPDSEASR
jgi:hypothetical protein